MGSAPDISTRTASHHTTYSTTSTTNTHHNMAGGDGKDKKPGEAVEYKFAIKPEEKTGWEGFKQFLWNSETSEFLGRTGMSWLKIGVFYIIYYTLLAGFFMGMLVIFYQTLDKKEPRWLNKNSIIGDNPGVGFRPMPPSANIESTLVWFRHGDDNGNWEDWVERLEQFLQPYKNDTIRDMGIECGPFATNKPGKKQICRINREELFQGDCTYNNSYGYKQGNPCILLKLNRIYGWTPEPYSLEDEQILEEKKVPESLKSLMEKNKNDNNEDMNNRVWVECHGENPADIENAGEIIYYPDQGFSANYFPYENQEGYVSPAVFIQLANPRRGVMIAIECKAWASNIEHDSMERRGLAHFEVMID